MNCRFLSNACLLWLLPWDTKSYARDEVLRKGGPSESRPLSDRIRQVDLDFCVFWERQPPHSRFRVHRASIWARLVVQAVTPIREGDAPHAREVWGVVCHLAFAASGVVRVPEDYSWLLWLPLPVGS